MHFSACFTFWFFQWKFFKIFCNILKVVEGGNFGFNTFVRHYNSATERKYIDGLGLSRGSALLCYMLLGLYMRTDYLLTHSFWVYAICSIYVLSFGISSSYHMLEHKYWVSSLQKKSKKSECSWTFHKKSEDFCSAPRKPPNRGKCN